MKSQLSNHSRLEQYSALALGLVVTAKTADAAVVVTDVDPDVNLSNSVYNIDFNGDGIDELEIGQVQLLLGGDRLEFMLLSNVSASGLAFVSSYAGGAAALPANQTFAGSAFNNLGFIYETAGGYGYYGPGSTFLFGEFAGTEDNYLGIRFELPDGLHYGWVRLDVAPDYSVVTVKQFAFESDAGVPILTGTCDTQDPPAGLVSTQGFTEVILSWETIPQSVGCQVSGTRFLPTGASGGQQITGFEVSSVAVPFTAVGPGTIWQWKVRCACSLSPLETTPYSVNDFFLVPLLREAGSSGNRLYPNPASDFVNLELEEKTSRDLELSIFDLNGSKVDFIRMPAEARKISIDVSALEEGFYFIQVGDDSSIPVEIRH